MSVEAMKQALVALDDALGYGSQRLDDKLTNAITSLRQAIEQAEKPFYKVEGPLHVVCQCDKCKAQPQREWVGLTDGELKPLCDENHIIYGAYAVDFIQSIEAKLKEKNT